jgi:hypothetical protein
MVAIKELKTKSISPNDRRLLRDLAQVHFYADNVVERLLLAPVCLSIMIVKCISNVPSSR